MGVPPPRGYAISQRGTAIVALISYNFLALLHFIPEILKSMKRWLPLVFYLKQPS